ncbi:ABC transporter permease [Streptomyces radiopugnans]|nr:ABC transporter permease [Streptomyces radiopugnans]
MNPVWYAARTGLRRGWTELKQTFTSGQDVFGYVLWTVLLIVPLFLVGDDPLEGAGISAGAFMLPSMLGMTLAFTGMMTTAQLLATEREDGTLLRAKAVPHGMVGHLVGKVVMVSGTAVVSMALPFAVGVFMVDGVAQRGGGALLTLVWVVPLGLLATL